MNGGSYVYYVRCRDSAGNATTADTTISFAVASPPPPDTTPPTVSVTAPAEGASVGQSVTVSATAADNTGVTGVQFLLDGVALGAEDTTGPYSVVWNTTTATNGPHTLSARARDAAGNLATSAVVNVTVAQPAIDPTLRVAYGFNETTGTVAVDRSSTANNATVTSGTWVTGRTATASGSTAPTTAPAQLERDAERTLHVRGVGAEPRVRQLRDGPDDRLQP